MPYDSSHRYVRRGTRENWLGDFRLISDNLGSSSDEEEEDLCHQKGDGTVRIPQRHREGTGPVIELPGGCPDVEGSQRLRGLCQRSRGSQSDHAVTCACFFLASERLPGRAVGHAVFPYFLVRCKSFGRVDVPFLGV